MSNSSLVSCVIIFYNQAQFIEQAIQSVLAQTYPHWELILVDDGSDDTSTSIAKQYANRHSGKIRYVAHAQHENLGMSASRNAGVLNAVGDYIGFLDADDIWLSNKLEQQVAILDTLPKAAMVYGYTLIWYSWSGRAEDKRRDHFYHLGINANTLAKPPRLFLSLLSNHYQSPTTCNALVRREVYNQVGGFDNTFRGMYEDQVFFAKVTLLFNVFVADKCWAWYRQHPGSCSTTTTQSYSESRLTFLNWVGDYLSTQSIQDKRILRNHRWEMLKCRYPCLIWLIAWLRVPVNFLHGFLRPPPLPPGN